MEVPKVTRPMDVKSGLDNLSLEQQWALAEDMEMQQWQLVRFLGSLDRILESKLLSCDLGVGFLSFLCVIGDDLGYWKQEIVRHPTADAESVGKFCLSVFRVLTTILQQFKCLHLILTVIACFTIYC